MESRNENNKISTPLAIVFAGILIALAILYNKTGVPTNPNANTNQVKNVQPASTQDALQKINPVSIEDHIRGNSDADIVIVEYSDTECPFCKQFHQTMKQIYDEYGKVNKVAWVYRHFPIPQLHSKAPKEAEALECAAAQGGNEKFWQYTDRIYEITTSNNSLDPAELPKIAEFVGLDVKQFNDCLSSSKFKSHVESDAQNAAVTGGGGTPWSIIVSKDGKKYPLSGAQPINVVKQIIESILKK